MNIQHGIVDIISPHVNALMQVMTNDFPQYNMRMITTKCLNTAILITFSLLGEKGLRIVDECDSNRVTERHKAGIDNNVSIVRQLRQQLTSKREKKSKLYYVLLSDGYFPQYASQNPQDTKYFPGHVIIIEKHYSYRDKTHVFKFHQSYINKYTLKQYNAIANKRLSMDNINNILDGLEKVLTSSVWSHSNIKIWSKITNVDTTNLLHTASANRFFLCFRKAKIHQCVSVLQKYIKSKLKNMEGLQPNVVYGDINLYHDLQGALTNGQIRQELTSLMYKIDKHETICFNHNNE